MNGLNPDPGPTGQKSRARSDRIEIRVQVRTDKYPGLGQQNKKPGSGSDWKKSSSPSDVRLAKKFCTKKAVVSKSLNIELINNVKFSYTFNLFFDFVDHYIFLYGLLDLYV